MSGCLFRCPFCFNTDVVLNTTGINYTESDIFSFLQKANGDFSERVIDAICVSGGEPLLHTKQLVGFCRQAQELGYKVKLDTTLCGGDINDLLPYIDGVSISLKAESRFLELSRANILAVDQADMVFREIRLILTEENHKTIKEIYMQLIAEQVVTPKHWKLYTSHALTMENRFGDFTELETEQLVEIYEHWPLKKNFATETLVLL